MPARNPWDRRDSETTPAFQAFRTYLDAGSNRSNALVARTLGKSVQLMNRWSSTHDWVDRVASYEAHEARLVDEAAFSQATQRARARKMAEQSQLSQEALTQIDVAFLNRIQAIARAPRGSELSKQWDAIPLEQLARLVALAARARRGPAIIERLSRNMSTDNLGNADGSVIPGMERAELMTEDELDAVIERLSAAADDPGA